MLDLAQLTDPNGVEVQEGPLENALRDASAEVDGYLRGRYVLPLLEVPANLVLFVVNMAVYNLLRLRPQLVMEDVRTRYEDAVRYLRGVAKGELHLSLSRDTAEAAPEPAGVVFVSAPPMFSRRSLEGL